MKAKFIVCALAATAVIAASAAFDDSERSAIRKSVAAVESTLKSAQPLDGKAITVLPVKGDADEFCERLVIGALVSAGKTCVVSNDEKRDERFKRILNEIKWDEQQTTLKSIDPRTADELGHLKSTQLLLEVRLDLFRRGRKRRAVAELNILAYEVKTKQYVWTANIALDESGRAWPDVSEFNVKVDVSSSADAARLAALSVVEVRNAVAGYGYRVNGEGAADLELTVKVGQETFDRSGGYIVLNGTAAVRLSSPTDKDILHETTFTKKGGRGLGEEAAVRNLSGAVSGAIIKWLDGTLKPEVFFAKHRDFASVSGR